MRTIRRFSTFVCWLGFCLTPLLLGSCASRPAAPPPLPPAVSFNPGAGRGDYLLLTLRLADGEKLLFAVDTGVATTILDKSLEPKLGQRRRNGLIWYGYFGPRSTGYYAAPALYLGDTRLELGEDVNTDDLAFLSYPGQRLAGILGMDCLKHYCLQLDFQSNTLQFLDPDRLATNALGRPFPLTTFGGEVSAHLDWFGVKNASVKLDTADYTDGALSSGLYRRAFRELQRSEPTNRWAAAASSNYMGLFSGKTTRFPRGSLGGETYDDLILHECPNAIWFGRQNLLGLRLLARHRVTLNFPGRTLWLRRESAGPLPDDLFALMTVLGYANDRPAKDAYARFAAYVKQQPGGALWLAANQFLETLKHQGRLPGWNQSDRGYIWFDLAAMLDLQQEIRQETYPATRTLLVHKTGSPAGYHYVVRRNSRDSAWTLQRAWRTDAGGKFVEEYAIP
jgi:hypothetical protein